MAINIISVQHNGGFLNDVMLLTLCYSHRGIRFNFMKRFCPWQPMFPPKRFDGMLGRFSCFQIFL